MFRRLVRGPVVSTGIAKYGLPGRFLSTSASAAEDAQLIQSFSLIGRISSTWDALMEKKGYTLSELRRDGVVVSFPAFTDLQNPVFKKYEFSPGDFIKGASEAFRQVNDALSSISFYNAVNGFTKQSDDDELLKLSLSPYLYKACRDAAKEFAELKKPYKFEKIDVNDSVFLRAKAHIFEDTDKIGRLMLEKAVSVLNDDPKVAAESKEVSEFATLLNENGIKFSKAETTSLVENIKALEPAHVEGSVIARVDVMFDASQGAHRRNTVWTFEGCLSGQSELDWRVVAFDGLGLDRAHIPMVEIEAKSEAGKDEDNKKN